MAAGEASAPRPIGRAGRRPIRTAILVVTLLLTGACGARWSDEERATVHSRGHDSGSDDEDANDDDDEEGDLGIIIGTDGSATDGTGGTTGGTGGTGGTTGGTASASAGGAAGPLPCSAPSEAPGVSAESITVGNISTISGPVPGLGEPSVAGVRAYLAYRNATGGVCGRKLELRSADDGLENARYRAAATDFAKSALGLVGGFAGGDGGAIDVLTGNKMPAVMNAFNDSAQSAPTVFDINPPFQTRNAVTGKYRFLHEQGVRTAAVATIAQASSLSELNQQVERMEAVGIRVVNRQELPLSTLSYDAPARAVANSKADYFLFLGAGNLNTSMARSLADTGYKLKFSEFLTAYGTNFIDVVGPGAEGVTSWTRSLPVEETSHPQVKLFLEWMRRVAPGIPPDTFAADSWASAKAFFESVERLSGPITRDGLLAQLTSLTSYDAEGFYGSIDLGGRDAKGCSVAMRVEGGKWTRLTPASGFLC
jgi:ABC-type branched-subunit amino acid transport system substrate-binding protein